jgi:hypothetical protein
VVTSPLRTRFIYDCREGEAVALLRDAELVTAMELRDFSDRKERTPGALSEKALKSAFGGRILGARKLCESATMTPGIAAGAGSAEKKGDATSPGGTMKK